MRGQIVQGISRWLLVAVCLCGSVVVAAAGPRAKKGHPKPSAPVEVKVEARSVGGATYEVTLTATPKRDVTGLVLDLDGRKTTVGKVKAGEARTVTARVSLGALRGRDVAGGASVDVGHSRRRAAAAVRVGEPGAAAPPMNVVRLPDGSMAAEVRQ